MRSRRLVVPLIIAAITLLVSCGSGSERSESSEQRSTTTSTTVVDLDTWSTELDRDCSELNERFSDLADTDPSTKSEAIAYARDVDAFAEAIVDAVHSGSVPDDRVAEAEELVTLAEQLEEATTELSDGAEESDTEQIDAATAEITRLGGEINPVAKRLGVPSCGGF